MYLARYVMCGDGVISLYRDSPLRLCINMADGSSNITSVTISCDYFERALGEGHSDVGDTLKKIERTIKDVDSLICFEYMLTSGIQRSTFHH